MRLSALALLRETCSQEKPIYTTRPRAIALTLMAIFTKLKFNYYLLLFKSSLCYHAFQIKQGNVYGDSEHGIPLIMGLVIWAQIAMNRSIQRLRDLMEYYFTIMKLIYR